MSFKNHKRSAKFKSNGMRVNCDGSTIKDRKPALELKSNHYHYLKRTLRIWNPTLQGTAISNGNGWYQ